MQSLIVGGNSMISKNIAAYILVVLAILTGVYLNENTNSIADDKTTTVQGNIIFILDASGSMWGRVESKEKIVVAKEVMNEIIDELPDNINIGLISYGHRRKGDCNDIETLKQLSKINKEELKNSISSITPKGKTPITKSLELAGDSLLKIEDESNIILISDGKETCGGDPCALTKKLREKGINVNVHVVGFDVTQEEKKQLQCIADAGEGKYFSANNISQLRDALVTVKKEIVEKAEVASTLDQLRWEMPCKPGYNGNICSAVDQRPIKTATLGGQKDQLYEVKLRFRGVVEQNSYTDGVQEDYLYIGGRSNNRNYNIYKLHISEPEQTYFLNAGKAGIRHAWPIDYTKTIKVKGGATVTLSADAQDGALVINTDNSGNPIVVADVPPYPEAYNGQLIQMDVISVNPVSAELPTYP